MYRIWRNVHLWLALISALPLMVLGVTGGLLSFDHAIRAWTNRAVHDIEPQGQPLPVDEAMRRVIEQYPDRKLYHTSVFADPTRPYRIWTNGGMIFVNPYTGAATAMAPGGGLVGRIDQLHRSLAMGRIGRYIVGGSTAVMMLVLCSGLYLWWRIRGGTLRRLVRKGDALSWHTLLGLVVVAPLLVMGATGLTHTLRMFGINVVAEPANPDVGPKPAGVEHMTLPQALAIAQRRWPDKRISGFGARGNRLYLVLLADADSIKAGGWERVYIDAHTGETVLHEDLRQASPGAMLSGIWGGLHSMAGYRYGLALLWAMCSFALPVLLVTGLWRWLGRNRRGVAV